MSWNNITTLPSRLSHKLKDWTKRESYSQFGEDLMVSFIFDHFQIQQPRYLDIGAYDPKALNNTYLLYKAGSTGINIEQNVHRFNRFLRSRPRDTNLNIGISEHSEVLTYYEMDADVLNTFSEAEAHHYVAQGHQIKRQIPVQTKSIAQVLQDSGQQRFPEFLDLDCEGMELEILKTIDFKNNFPLVICLETIEYSKSLGQGRKRSDLIDLLLANNYTIFADTYVNTIFLNRALIQ